MTETKGDRVLHGLGVCPGKVAGTLWWVHYPRLPSSYPSRDRKTPLILGMAMTTPDVLPYLDRFEGVVTSVGGVTCHAAVLAREMGIPTVVGCGRLNAGSDGKAILLDGESGCVKLL